MTTNIHTSDRGTFKNCRRRWDFVSPIRQNLRPKLTYGGVSFPLWFGTGIHKALELYYDPKLSRDPEEVWNTWYHDSTRAIKEKAPDVYNNDEEQFIEHLELGLGMMKFYKSWASVNDLWFEVIDTEANFSVQLQPDRLVNYVGRRDAIVRDLRNGRYGIIDHKTTARIDEEFYVKLEMDEQCSGYLAAQRAEGTYNPEFVIYNSLRKAFPKPPSPLFKRNTDQVIGLSVDRQKESTTADMFDKAVAFYGLDDWLETNLKAQGYREYLAETGDEQFILRHTVLRNDTELENTWQQVIMEAHDMTNNPLIYPNPSASWYCTKCPFRAPCIAMNDGSDYKQMLADNYETNPRDDSI